MILHFWDSLLTMNSRNFRIKGFEARGTVIGQKLTAWRNLLDETRPRGKLTANPYDSSRSAADNFPMEKVNSFCFLVQNKV